MPSKTCPKCNGSMSQGFVVDHTHGGTTVPSWVEGAPQRSIWTGVRLDGKPQIEIETWRCGRCGFLENYAAGGPSQYEERRKRIGGIVVIFAILSAVLMAGLGILLSH